MSETMYKETVFSVSNRILNKFGSTLESGSTKAVLANLRNSIGKSLSESIGVWKEFFSEIPDEFLNTNGTVSKELNAIFAVLQLYALHQQSKIETVNSSGMDLNTNNDKEIYEDMSKNIGASLNILRQLPNVNSIDQRFNAMITATSFKEMVVHLKHLISILKANNSNKINYAKLAEDLFYFQTPYQEKIRLRWGISYYKNYYKEKNNE